MVLQTRDIPNIITILRMLLVVPVIYLLLVEEFFWSLIVFIIAGISDAVDGFLAKRFNWVSDLGERLDPLADKLLMASCYLGLAWTGHLPVWLVIIVLGRDLLIVLVAIIYQYKFGHIRMIPTFTSKANTAVQILLICVVLFSLSVMIFPNIILNTLSYIVLSTTVISGIHYVVIWTRKLRTLKS